MAVNRYAQFYGAFNTSLKNGNTATKEETVQEFTAGRTKSLQDLSDEELKLLIDSLNKMSGSTYVSATPEEKEKDVMRKAIIAQFHLMYRTPSSAIAWSEKYGVKKVKKRFNDYNKSELFLLLQNAKQVVADWQAAMRKKVI